MNTIWEALQELKLDIKFNTKNKYGLHLDFSDTKQIESIKVQFLDTQIK